MNDSSPVRTLVWFWGTGGAGVRFAARVAESIAETHGPENVGLAVHADNAWIGRSRERGHPVMTVAGASGHRAAARIALQAASRWFELRRQVLAFQPDVVVVPMTFALAWPHCLAFAGRVPLVYVAHDDRPHLGDYRPGFQTRLQSLMLARADQAVTVSQYVAGQIERSGRLRGKPACAVVPLSAHDVARRREPRRASSDGVSLLFLGRLISYKGLALLAEALGALRDRPGWRLTIAGDGPEAASVRTLFGSFRQVDLSRLRPLAEAEVDELIETHDVLVCPYLEASQSGVVTEALYKGVPSLVTPVGALPEQIGFGQAGWVAPSVSGEGLREAIRTLLDDPGAIERASAGALAMVAPPRGDAWARLVEGVARSRAVRP